MTNKVRNSLLIQLEQIPELLFDFGKSYVNDIEIEDKPSVEPPLEHDPLDRKYKVPNIQKLLLSSLDDRAFNQFCMFYFEDVYNTFSDGQARNQKILRLLDYCRRFMKFQLLLDNIKELNEAQFEVYKPYY